MITSGQSIGNYRILAKIGTGGMGAVYLAEHPLIGKKVALKVIHRELSGNREVVQRFFQEARAVNKIGNEHIVEIHDFGVTPEGDHFYIMEYLEGRTLASVLSEESRLEVQRALHIGAQIASALAAAHASGVLHRDLKPDNIMLLSRLGDHDFVKVLDFGLAKMFAEDGVSAVKTAAGVLLGTPQYMSPEACESKGGIDHRTDVYALGILLFQMLTGVLPFDGESMGEVLMKQVTALPPAPRGLVASIPPSVEQVLLRCLAKAPDGRFATMFELREALLDPESYLRASPPISAARSVGPGEAPVDGRTMARHAEAVQKAKLAGLPLPAPPRAGTDQAFAAPTMIAEAGARRSTRMPAGVPGLAPPAETKNNTMRIATPMGYSSRPPKKVWPVVLVLGLLLGLGGGAFAVAWFGRGQGDARAVAPQDGGGPGSAITVASLSRDATAEGDARSALDAGSTGATTPPAADAGISALADAGRAVDAGGVAPDPGDAGSATTLQAKLSIDSVPPNATVMAPDGRILGKTPLKIPWPVSAEPVLFELRLGGYRKKQRAITVTGNLAIQIELERLPRAVPGKGSDAGTGQGTGDTGLMRPE